MFKKKILMSYYNELTVAMKDPMGMWHRDVAECYWQLFQLKDMLGRLRKYRYLVA